MQVKSTKFDANCSFKSYFQSTPGQATAGVKIYVCELRLQKGVCGVAPLLLLAPQSGALISTAKWCS